MRGMTRDEFVTKARAAHGDKYDYSKVVYVNQSVDVIIICPEHGEFLQRPNNHYMGAGCPLCVGNHKMTTETFIKRAREIHGDKYDYSKSVYVNSKTKLIISCPEHGDFEQSPDKHLSGHGCPMCAQSKVEATNLQKYGAKRPLQNKEIHEKSVQTCLDKYGVRNPMQSKAVLQKQIATNVERYGVPFSYMKLTVHRRSSVPAKTLAVSHRIMADGCKLHMEKPKRSLAISSLSQYVKYYHQDVFYAREKSLWKENPIFRKQSLQMFLYQNRQKYLGKSPEQLTDFDILRGFSISGVLRGYTAFDARVMERILKEYSICSVADPCAGWGERLLCCYLNDVEYYGYDINQGLLPGYTAMIKDFQITKQSVLFADASTVKLQSHYDAVITCPPYHNVEIYIENGAENLSYTDFLLWWEKVVQNFSDVKYFCFQINQKYKSDMIKIVLEQGFFLVKEILPKNKVSHFHRKNGSIQKQEYESMLVFQKCCS